MAGIDLRATRLDIANEATDATSVTITFVDGAGEPVDLSDWTFTAPILTIAGVAAGAFTPAVDANTVTLQLAAGAVPRAYYRWGLVATAAGAASTWLAGSFLLTSRGIPATRPTTPVTVTLATEVTVTASINVGGGGGPVEWAAIEGKPEFGTASEADAGDFDPAGAATAALAAHVAAVDPHTQYVNAAELAAALVAITDRLDALEANNYLVMEA